MDQGSKFVIIMTILIVGMFIIVSLYTHYKNCQWWCGKVQIDETKTMATINASNSIFCELEGCKIWGLSRDEGS